MSADTTTAIIALIGATFGGGGLKLIEYFLTKGRDKDTTAIELRKELRDEASNLRAELKEVQDDLDKWKAKYYDLLEQFSYVKIEIKQLQQTIEGTKE